MNPRTHLRWLVSAVAPVAVLATVGLAACASHAAAPAEPAAAQASSAAPSSSSCAAQLAAWKSTPSAKATERVSNVLGNVSTGASQLNAAALASDLNELGSLAGTMHVSPMPSCADVQGYWAQLMQQLQRAESEASGVAAKDAGAVQAADGQLQQMGRLAGNLSSELREAG